MKTRTAWLLVTMVLLCSCATFRSSEGLNVSITNIGFAESTLFETNLKVTVRIANETAVPLLLEGGVHKIYLNGLYVGEGLSNETLEIPRLSSTTQTVTTHLQNLSLLTRIRGIIDSQRVDYRIVSTIYVKENGRSVSFRVARDGTVDLQEFQPTRPLTPQP